MKRYLAMLCSFVMLFTLVTPASAATPDISDPDAAVGIPVISSIAVSSGELVARESEEIRVGIQFTPNSVVTQVSCRVKVFWRNGSTDTLIGSKQVTITKNTAVYVPVTFPSYGSRTIVAKIYDTSSSSTPIGTSNTMSVTVYGRWSINITLPKDRDNEGTLKLYDGNGNQQLSIRCLGQSVSDEGMGVTNGNTPTGTYSGILDYHYGENLAFGPYKVVKLTAITTDFTNRTDIWIHGGRGTSDTATDYILEETNGCVRVTNGHQLQIQNIITSFINNSYYYSGGIVTIVER